MQGRLTGLARVAPGLCRGHRPCTGRGLLGLGVGPAPMTTAPGTVPRRLRPVRALDQTCHVTRRVTGGGREALPDTGHSEGGAGLECRRDVTTPFLRLRQDPVTRSPISTSPGLTPVSPSLRALVYGSPFRRVPVRGSCAKVGSTLPVPRRTFRPEDTSFGVASV